MPTSVQESFIGARMHQTLHLMLAWILAPLVLGCAIFLAWCATAWNWLQTAGMLNICFGLLVTVGVGIFLLVHFTAVVLTRPVDWYACFGGLLVVAVLLVNFFACSVIVETVIRLESAQDAIEQSRQPKVVVVNMGESPVLSLVVSGTSYNNQLGPLATNEGLNLILSPEDLPEFTFEIEGVPEQQEIQLTLQDGRLEDFVIVVQDGRAKVATIPRWNARSD